MTPKALPSSSICLVRPALKDAPALLAIENSPLVWRYSGYGDAPYTIDEIEAFINASDTLLSSGQMRFLINLGDGGDNVERHIIGTADLYNYNAHNGEAWVAIVVYPFSLHRNGYGAAALKLLIEQAASLGIGRLYAQIDPRNSASLALFTAAGFSRTDARASFVLSLRPLYPPPPPFFSREIS